MQLCEPAPAKVNLALHLRRRRDDGYHEIETVFAFTEFGDTLTVQAATDLSLRVSGEFAGPAGAGPDNLVIRAAQAYKAASRPAGRRLCRLWVAVWGVRVCMVGSLGRGVWAPGHRLRWSGFTPAAWAGGAGLVGFVHLEFGQRPGGVGHCVGCGGGVAMAAQAG
jgi:hypothetical protein